MVAYSYLRLWGTYAYASKNIECWKTKSSYYRARCFGRTKLSLFSQSTDCTSFSARVVVRHATREHDSVHEATVFIS